MVAAGFCLSFFLGTLMNLLYIPGFDHHQTRDNRVRFYGEKQHRVGSDSQLHVRVPATETDTESNTKSETGSLQDLQLQIRERYDEVARYRRRQSHGFGRGDSVRPHERRRLMDLEPFRTNSWDPVKVIEKIDNRHSHFQNSPSSFLHTSSRTGFALHSRSINGTPMLGCNSIDNVTNVQYLGSGYTKAVYKAVLNQTLSVALKSVDFGGHDMEGCVKKYESTGDCYRLASFKIVKEMTLMERLQHPNILKLYGYCYQDNNDIRDTVTAITELGTPLEMITLLQTSWEERFRICLSLVRLLHYLAHSPLGSVTLLDFRPRQFVLVEGELKVTDLDDASTEEALCSPGVPADCVMDFPARNFSLPCQRGRCVGINEKRNLYNAYRFFFTYLLPHSAPPSLRPLLDKIVNSTGELLWGVDETLAEMENVLHLYKNGFYLQNSTRTHSAEYRRVSDSSVPGEDYRCWPSHQHDGCLLSVYGIQEAVSVCESHVQCRAFVLTNQTTWTGHQLVYFKTGSASLSAAKGRHTYIRMAT